MRTIIVSLLFSLLILPMSARSEYRLPPQEVIDIIDAKPEPLVRLSPDGKWMIMIELDSMPSIEDLARRMLQLAGLRIDPVANGGFQTSFYRGLSLRSLDQNQPIQIPLPQNVKIGGISWSHTSQKFAFTVITDVGKELWLVDVEQPDRPVRLTDRLSTVLAGWEFMPDDEHILCHLVPENRGSEPAPPKRPVGPNIQESIGNTSPIRTYQDLLSNPHDEALFEFYGTTQMSLIDAQGQIRLLGEPDLFQSSTPSPNGEYLLVTTLKRPFSYLLPYSSFPQGVTIWSVQGDKLLTVADIPMEENIPIQGVRTGPRAIRWAASEPAKLYWFEALDGGDPRVAADHRDQLVGWSAPFDTAPEQVFKIQHRASGIQFFSEPNRIVVTDFDRDRRWIRTQLVDLNQPDAAPAILVDRSIRDQYGDPGQMWTKVEPSGYSTVQQDGDWTYWIGQGASPQGYLPFLDRLNLSTMEKERLWRCELGWRESVVSILRTAIDTRPSFITRRESQTSPPNYWLRDLEKDHASPITAFEDPTPQIRNIHKELVTYQRADGVPLSATLYLPADYEPGQKLPLLIWAYPLEYNDPDTAGQIATSPNQFTRIVGISHLALLTQGYAIMDNATMPVVGDPETMNDTFVDQIVMSAQAAIDKAVEMGVADRQRVAVGGHSYGAFMTANLLAHSNLFRAGVARSGAYNRTLTPFGFQSERRPFWEAREVYINVSPFTHANKIKSPILLVHGENDDNSGTFPIQSQRLYQAIKGNGGIVRLVMLPHESHGYRARESVMHTHAETIDWLNRYVRDADRDSSESQYSQKEIPSDGQ